MAKDVKCNTDIVQAFIANHVPEAKLKSNIGSELGFLLPRGAAGKFEGLFSELEGKRCDLGVSSYGCSITTMEEVFLRVSGLQDVDASIVSRAKERGAIRALQARDDVPIAADEDTALLESQEKTQVARAPFALKSKQFHAMVVKRYKVRN